MSSICVNHVSKAFGSKQVLCDVSLCFEEGLTTCLMGPSGCGKTTLLRIISGLETADTGEVLTNGKKISYVFQEERLSENYSVAANIRFIAGKAASREAAEQMLRSFGLGDSVNTPVSLLSGGMKRRATIAAALCAPYDLLLLDEPFKGLDAQRKQSVMRTVKQKTEGKTVIFVTHDPAEAAFLAHKTIPMPTEK